MNENEIVVENEGTDVMDLETTDMVESTGGSKVGIAIGVALVGAAAAGAVALFKKSKLRDKINERKARQLEAAGYEVYAPEQDEPEEFIEDSDEESED